MKKVMILGAGIYQVPLIKKAKEMGLYTIVVSCPGNYPGFSLADQIYEIDTTDYQAVCQAARENQIDGICTTGTDVAVKTIGYVCDRLNLPGISGQAAETLTCKAHMKEAFQKTGVRSAAYETATNWVQAQEIATRLGYPLMIKAVDKSGSRGVTKVSNDQELIEGYHAVEQVSSAGICVLEEFINGVEIGVDGMIDQGEMILFLPHQKFVYRTDYHTSIPAGHGFPYEGDEQLLKDIRQQMELMIQASGADHCCFNADVMISPEGQAYVIEAGARAGATGIPELISIYTGRDYYELMLRQALGQQVAMTDPLAQTPCMSKLIFPQSDLVIGAYSQDQIRALEDDHTWITLDYPPGTAVTKVKDGTDRVGQVVYAGDSVEKLEAVVAKIEKLIF